MWLWASFSLAICLLVVLGYLLVPEDRYTGTNSVSSRSVVASVRPGEELCVPQLDVPKGTGRIRLRAFWSGARSPGFEATLRTSGRRLATRVAPAAGRSPVQGVRVDLPFAKLRVPSASVRGTLCLSPLERTTQFGGMAKLQSNQVSPTLDGRPIGSRVAVWFLPREGERHSLIGVLPDALGRAARFRPEVVGGWTYVLLLFLLPPALWLASVRLFATRVSGATGGARTALAVGAIALATAATWALVTPPFDGPDEPDHFAYAQHLAESGDPPDRSPSSRRAYSSSAVEALEAMRVYSFVESPEGRPPWLGVDERRFERRWNAARASSDNGGGYLVSTAAHSPAYYTLTVPAYYAASSGDIFDRLTLMRFVSALLGALTAALAFLAVRELFSRHEWAAVAAGLLVAFQPMFGFMSGVVNNDAGVNAAAALLVYLMLRGLRRGLTLPLGVATGATAAMLPLMKGTGYALYPALAVALTGMVWRRHSPRQLVGLGALVGTAAGAQGIWSAIARSFDRTTLTTPGGGSGPVRRALDAPDLYLSYLWQTFAPRLPFMTDLHSQRWPAYDIYVERGFAAFGWYAVKFPIWVYVLIAVAALAAGALCAVALWRERIAARARGWELTALVVAVVGVIGGVAAAYMTSHGDRPVVAEQGRYAFTAIVPLATIALGACFAFGRRRAPAVAGGVVGAMMGLGYASLWLAFEGFFA